MEAINANIDGLRDCKWNGNDAGNSPLESTVAVINDFMPEVNALG
jgi:D-citramalate synthase